jgi:hypothetical protein
MRSVWKQAELHACMPTRIGLLRDVCSVLDAQGIDIRSIEAYDNDAVGEFYLITSDDELAAEKLGVMGADVASADVVCAELENRPGALLDLAATIAEAGINIWQMRATSAAGNTSALAVFRVEDPGALVEALRNM